MRQLTQAFFGIFWILIAVPTASATDRIIVGVEDIDYLPYYSGASGDYEGFGRQILDSFAADRGYEIDYQILPAARLFRALVKSEIDLKFPDRPIWSSDLKAGKKIVYSDAVIDYVDGVSVLSHRPVPGVDRIGSIGIFQGFTAASWQPFVEAGRVTFVENSSFEGLVFQAILGRIGGVFGNVMVIDRVSAEAGHTGSLIFAKNLPQDRGSYYLSSLRRPDLVAEFNQWMADHPAKIANFRLAVSPTN